MEQAAWLTGHWHTVAGIGGAVGGIVASLKWFPAFWRAFARAIASPLLLEIEREKLKAREEQVADLVEQIESLRKRPDGSAD